jgi:hypothetical protein
MQTEREYAISLGLAKPTRGRLSREAKAAIAKAKADGMQFSNPSYVVAKAMSKPRAPKSAEETEERTGLDLFAPVAQRTSPEGTYWTADVDGKRQKFTHATVCVPCGFSLGWHRCSTPRAVTSDGIRALTEHNP